MNDQIPVTVSERPVQESPLGWLRTEIDRLFDDFGGPARSIFTSGLSTMTPAPALELAEKENEYRLTAELPGLKEDDVEISIADGALTLSGEKHEEDERKDNGFLLRERRYGAFERRVPLPADVNQDAINAEFKHGVLTIVLPKDAQAAERTRKIAITAAS
ncbi:Hsp20/alpha crystallin family protein [Sphingomonas sp. S1-29]|uniref:Hsp20/alpha crystallin family protein n=1 Tax=Sphingomonas sp. S1-29 TaxID=2991074 RepID=UPI002240C789|nr:Hsp20/alpha crystallin family protein [Sphingomonas sp. S1-29]UZK70594.1 Hsp20/alpha crystallin family protein [Sphingomonas sp. S1-29]